MQARKRDKFISFEKPRETEIKTTAWVKSILTGILKCIEKIN